MATIQQIEDFKRRARAAGFSESQISTEVTRRLTQNSGQIASGVTQSTPTVETPPPVQTTKQKKSVGGFIKNAGQNLLNFAVNTPIQALKNTAGAGYEVARTSTLNSKVKQQNQNTQQLNTLAGQIKSEKDPNKRQQLIQQARGLRDQSNKVSEGISGEVNKTNPFIDINEVPTIGELGKGIARNIGSTFGITKDETGQFVFDPQLALDTAYENPVDTALVLAGGKNLIKKGAKGKVTTATKAAKKPGFIERQGTKMRKGVLNPQADASPFYTEDVARQVKTQKKLNLTGSATAQLEKLPQEFKKTQVQIKKKLNKATPPKKGTLTEQFNKEVENANYTLDDVQFNKSVESISKNLQGLEGKSAVEMYSQLDKYRQLLKSTRRKDAAGTTLLPKEEARLAAYNALMSTLDTVSPEVRQLLFLENQMYNISEGLVKSTKKPGMGVTALGTDVRLPTEFSQTIQDRAGAVLEKAGQLPGKVSEKVSSVTGKIPQVPAGQSLALGTTGILNREQPTDQGQDSQERPSEDVQGNGEQDNSQQNLNQDEDILAPTVHPVFGKSSKQEILLDAFKSGANETQLKQIEAMYDRFAPQQAGVVDEGTQKAASGLRTEYLAQTKQNGYMDIVNSYRKVVGATPNPAGDMSMIFAYMKMLDPGSTVREGEYASAEDTRGVSEEVVMLYNKTVKGEKLSDRQRDDFKAEAKRILKDSTQVQSQIDKIYTDLAKRYGVDPTLVGIGAIKAE